MHVEARMTPIDIWVKCHRSDPQDMNKRTHIYLCYYFLFTRFKKHKTFIG